MLRKFIFFLAPPRIEARFVGVSPPLSFYTGCQDKRWLSHRVLLVFRMQVVRLHSTIGC